MIPFVRVLKYGNIVDEPDRIEKFGLGTTYFSCKTDFGKLFISGLAGTNFYGQADTGFHLIGENIDNVWYSKTSVGMVAQSGNTYYMLGMNYNASSLGGSKFDITSRINAVLSTLPVGTSILDIQVEPHLMILFSNGDLYGVGYNSSGQLGTGNTTIVSVLRLLASNVKKFMTCQTGTIYITNNGDFYGCGIDYNISLGGSNRLSYTKFGTSTYTDCYLLGGISGLQNILAYDSVQGYWVGQGTNVTQLGGTFANTSVLSRLTPRPSTYVRDNSIADGYGNINMSTVGGQLYVTGSNFNGLTGLGISTNTVTGDWTLVPGSIGVKQVRGTNTASMYLTESAEIYATGQGLNGLFAGVTNTYNRYTKLNINIGG